LIVSKTETVWGTGPVAFDGTTLLIGNDVFTEISGQWIKQATIFIAKAVASGSMVVADNFAPPAIYTLAAGTWSKQADLTPTAPFVGQIRAAAIDADTVLLADDSLVHVFVRVGSTWTEQTTIQAGGIAPLFGTPLAVHGDTAVVNCAAQATCVYVRNGTSWSLQAKLEACDGSASGDFFGSDLALWGDRLIVGAAGAEKAYVFERSGTTWIATAALRPPAVNANNWFGASVALYGDVAVVGEPYNISGAVHFFFLHAGSWTSHEELAPAGANVNMGKSGSVWGNRAIVSNDTMNGVAHEYTLAVTDGAACSSVVPCASGQCVDGVCCDTACAGSCESCLGAAKVFGADGTCGQVKAGTLCSTQGCVSGASQAGDACDQDGVCQPKPALQCAVGYVCIGGACQTSCQSDAQCDTTAGFFCVNGKCGLPLGAACSADSVCTSGFCRDGVCCDTDCGACQACSKAEKGFGEDGACAPYAADTDPDDDCAEAKDYPKSCLSDGLCDGKGACRQFAVKGTVCEAEACVEAQLSSYACDGAGYCEPATVQCFPYQCSGAKTCGTACQTNADCVTGTECLQGECKAAGAICKPDGHTVAYPDGTESECAPYACLGGICKKACASTVDCASGRVCDAAKGTCVSNDDSGADESGCGCRVGGSPRDGAGWLVALFATMLLRRRSRRARGRSVPASR